MPQVPHVRGAEGGDRQPAREVGLLAVLHAHGWPTGGELPSIEMNDTQALISDGWLVQIGSMMRSKKYYVSPELEWMDSVL